MLGYIAQGQGAQICRNLDWNAGISDWVVAVRKGGCDYDFTDFRFTRSFLSSCHLLYSPHQSILSIHLGGLLLCWTH